MIINRWNLFLPQVLVGPDYSVCTVELKLRNLARSLEFVVAAVVLTLSVVIGSYPARPRLTRDSCSICEISPSVVIIWTVGSPGRSQIITCIYRSLLEDIHARC